MLINFIICFAIIIICIAISFVIIRERKNYQIIKDFPSYISVLEYYQKKAYEIIHKDRILIYSLEATSIPDKEYNQVSKDYVKLVEKLIGPRLLKQYIFLYGNYDTFLFNVLEFFNTTYDSDEIKKSALDDLQEKEIDEQNIGAK